jgi:hypothetical protein
MGKLKEIYTKVIDDCYRIYEQSGMVGVIEHVAEQQNVHNPEYKDVRDGYCTECMGEVPVLSNTCLVCGQETRPFAFEVIQQGWNADSKREEVQVKIQDSAILFLIKTDEGFIVDVFNEDECISTMPVWEDDYVNDEQLMGE